MKTKFNFILLLCIWSFSSLAQPQKGSLELGGTGYFTKVYRNYEDPELYRNTFSITAFSSYFLFKHLSVGTKFLYEGTKYFQEAYDPRYKHFIVGPTAEAYLLNKRVFGISIKSELNFAIKSDYSIDDKKLASFIIGPKASWNITPNLSTFLWFAYRDSKDWDYNRISGNLVPSKDFDINWGFSYYLHRKQKEE